MLHKDLVIVLVNFNGINDTTACVKSIRDHSVEQPFIILVDNSEPNDKKLDGLKDESLHIIYAEKNLGFGRANNVGIQWAQENIQFESLLLLNNDTLVTPGSLKTIQTSLKEKKADLVSCKIVYESEPSLVWYGGGKINYKKGWPELVDFNQQATPDGANQSRFVSFVSGCVILFSKNALDLLKGFDEAFFMYVEDLELSVRAEKAGLKIWYTSEAVILHKVQGSFSDNNQYKGMHPKNNNVAYHFYHKKRNQWITFRKHLNGREYRTFRRHYWANFFKILFRLFFLSPKRFKVLGAAFKVLRSLSLKNE